MRSLDQLNHLKSRSSLAEEPGFERRVQVLQYAAVDLVNLLRAGRGLNEDRIGRTLQNINVLFFGEYISSLELLSPVLTKVSEPASGLAHAVRKRPIRMHPIARNTKVARLIYKLLDADEGTLGYDQLSEYLCSKKSSVSVLAFRARGLLAGLGFPNAIETVHGTGLRIIGYGVNDIRIGLNRVAQVPWTGVSDSEMPN